MNPKIAQARQPSAATIDLKWRACFLCAATASVVTLLLVAVWIRSYLREDIIVWNYWSVSGEVQSSNRLRHGWHRGIFWVAVERRRFPGRDAVWIQQYRLDHPEYVESFWWIRLNVRDISFAPFNMQIGNSGPHDHYLVVHLPLWVLAASAAIVAALTARYWLRARRRRSLRDDAVSCPRCGYDMRATHDRCPECGTPFGGNKNLNFLAPGRVENAGVSPETCEQTANITSPLSANQRESGVSGP